MNLSSLSKVEHKFFVEAHDYQHWVKGMEEKLNQVEKNESW
jgi:hypothetical protein